MDNHRRWKIAIALLTVGGALLWWVLTPHEPTYQGKGTHEWLYELSKRPGQGVDKNAVVALRAIGPNAVPILLDELEARDSRFRQLFLEKARKLGLRLDHVKLDRERQRIALYGFAILGPAASNAIPVLTKRIRGRFSKDSAQALGVIAGVGLLLRSLGPPLDRSNPAEMARIGSIKGIIVTNLCHAVTNQAYVARRNAIDVLIDFEEDRSTVLACLVDIVRSETPQAANFAFDALYSLDPMSVSTVPALISMLEDPSATARIQAATVLARCGRLARSALPALEAIQNDPDLGVRSAVTRAIERIASPPTMTLPAVQDRPLIPQSLK